jgi:hypothetical protein
MQTPTKRTGNNERGKVLTFSGFHDLCDTLDSQYMDDLPQIQLESSKPPPPRTATTAHFFVRSEIFDHIFVRLRQHFTFGIKVFVKDIHRQLPKTQSYSNTKQK